MSPSPRVRRKRPRRRANVLALAVVVAACTQTTSEPALTAVDAPAEVLEAGENLYASSCSKCHGTDLRGSENGPSFLSIVYEPDHHGDIVFALAARNGVRAHHWNFGPMLPVEGLSDEDLEAIVAYVRVVQEREGFEPYP